MAAIALAAVTLIWTDTGQGGEIASLYRINNVTTADTFDPGSIVPAGAPTYKKIKAATMLTHGTLATVGTIAFSGTVGTITQTSLANDTIFVLVLGQR